MAREWSRFLAWPVWEQSHLLSVCAFTSIQRAWFSAEPPSSHLSCCAHSPGLSLIKPTDLMGLAQRTLRPHRTLHRAICPPSCQGDLS